MGLSKTHKSTDSQRAARTNGRKGKTASKTDTRKLDPKVSNVTETSASLPPLVTNSRKPVPRIVPTPPFNDEAMGYPPWQTGGKNTYFYDEWKGETTTHTTTTTKYRRRGVFVTSQSDYDDYDNTEPLRKSFWRYKPTGNKALDRFRRAVDFVLISRQLFRIPPPDISQDETMLYFLFDPTNSPPKIAFDTSQYQNIHERGTVSLIKETVNTPKESRSPQDISKLVNTMQTYGTFARYPADIQHGICQHAWFARFDRRRVLCRAGKRVDVVYFILSGVAVSRSYSAPDDPRSSDGRKQEATFLKKGDVIGEKELLKSQYRESTVITKEAVEVLALDEEDFKYIFQALMRNADETLSFLTSLDVFAGFPLDAMLSGNQCASSSHSYKRGSVIVGDSNGTEWVFVVKKGSCTVLKEVKGQTKRYDRRCSQHVTDQIDGLRHTGVSPTSFLPCIDPDGTLVSSADSRLQKYLSPNRISSAAVRRSSVRLPHIKLGDEKCLSSRTPWNTPREDYSSDEPRKASTKHQQHQQHERSNRSAGRSSSSSSYVKIDSLKPGDVFGLQTLIYDDSPSFVLVSRGAECILIAKKLFIDHMDATRRSLLQTKVPAYPSITRLQSAVQDSLEWDAFKKQTVSESLDR